MLAATFVPLALLVAPVRAEPASVQAATATVCPFLPAAADMRGVLLAQRVAFDVNPTGAELVGGIDLVGHDPHAVVPLPAWRQIVRWSTPNGMALILVDDPLARAPRDLADRARSGAIQRFGEAFLPTAVSVPFVSRQRGVKGVILAGPNAGDSWGAAGSLRFPDGSLFYVAAALSGDVATDPACRAAALDRLAGLGPGPRSRDRGSRAQPWDLQTGGTLHVYLPAGFAFQAVGGWEYSFAKAVQWHTDGDAEAEVISFGSSILGWETLPEAEADPIATATVLGETTQWRRSKLVDDVEEAWVQGSFGGKRDGVIRVEVRAATPARRKALRAAAERATLDLGTPASGNVMQFELPAEEVPDEAPATEAPATEAVPE